MPPKEAMVALVSKDILAVGGVELVGGGGGVVVEEEEVKCLESCESRADELEAAAAMAAASLMRNGGSIKGC